MYKKYKSIKYKEELKKYFNKSENLLGLENNEDEFYSQSSDYKNSSKEKSRSPYKRRSTNRINSYKLSGNNLNLMQSNRISDSNNLFTKINEENKDSASSNNKEIKMERENEINYKDLNLLTKKMESNNINKNITNTQYNLIPEIKKSSNSK